MNFIAGYKCFINPLGWYKLLMVFAACDGSQEFELLSETGPFNYMKCEPSMIGLGQHVWHEAWLKAHAMPESLQVLAQIELDDDKLHHLKLYKVTSEGSYARRQALDFLGRSY